MMRMTTDTRRHIFFRKAWMGAGWSGVLAVVPVVANAHFETLESHYSEIGDSEFTLHAQSSVDSAEAEAEELFGNGDYEGAALRFEALATAHSGEPDVEPRSLLRAAGIWGEYLGRLDRSLPLLETLTANYPNHPLVGRALEQIAEGAQALFDIDRALEALFALHELGEQHDRMTDSPLITAGSLLEVAGRPAEAAEVYNRWLAGHADHERAPEVAYRVGLAYDDADLGEEMVQAFVAFRDHYGDASPTDSFDVAGAWIDSLYRSAVYFERVGNAAEAETYYDLTLSAFARRPIDGSRYQNTVAEISFTLAVRDWAAWSAVNLGAVTPSIETIYEGVEPLFARFEGLDAYQTRDWTVCGLAMKGQMAHELASHRRAMLESGDAAALLSADDGGAELSLPRRRSSRIDEGSSSTGLAVSAAGLDQNHDESADEPPSEPSDDVLVSEWESMAVETWEIAYQLRELVDISGRCGVDVERQLHLYRPDQYPLSLTGLASETMLVPAAPALVAPSDRDGYQGADETSAWALALALDHLRAGDTAAGREALLTLSEDAAAAPFALYNLGVLALRNGEPDNAQAQFEAALEQYPAFAAALEALVYITLSSGDSNEGVLQARQRVEQQWLLTGGSAQIRAVALYVMLNDGEYGEVLRAGREVLLVDRFNADAHFAMGIAYHRLGVESMSPMVFSQGIGLNRNDVGLLVGAAEVMSLAGDHRMAEYFLEQALREDPLNPAALLEYGLMQIETRHFDAAIEVLLLLVGHTPEQSGAWNNLGNAYLGAGLFDDARDAFARSIALEPHLAQAFFGMGVLGLYTPAPGVPEAERLQGAIDAFATFIDGAGPLDANHPAIRHMAEAQLMLEQLDD